MRAGNFLRQRRHIFNRSEEICPAPDERAGCPLERAGRPFHPNDLTVRRVSR